MNDYKARNRFGALAFIAAAAVIILALSPLVADSKADIANIVVGNALNWPGLVLAYFFGSSSGSKAKDAALAQAASVLPLDGAELPHEAKE